VLDRLVAPHLQERGHRVAYFMVERLVLRSTEIDSHLEANPDTTLGILSHILRTLRVAVHRLKEQGFNQVIIATDHGFFLNSQPEAGDLCTRPPGDWTSLHDRALLGEGVSDAQNGGDRQLATLEPSRRRLKTPEEAPSPAPEPTAEPESAAPVAAMPALAEQHYTIGYGDTGHTYDSIVGPYVAGAKAVTVEDPYIRAGHQINNLVRFCETVVKQPTVRKIQLITSYDEKTDVKALAEKVEELKQSLLEIDVVLDVKLNENLHDREIRMDNGWVVKIGRGLDFYQKPDSWFGIGANDYSLRRCLETKVDIFREET